MKCASVPSAYRKVILRASVRIGRNFSPARKVLSITAPSSARLSFVRTNAPPLPGLTCWNSTILKIVPSTSMWVPFLNWLVLITVAQGSEHAVASPRQLHLIAQSRLRVRLELDECLDELAFRNDLKASLLGVGQGAGDETRADAAAAKALIDDR